MRKTTTCLALAVAALGSAGCATTIVEPGHRGLYFEPNGAGLKREVLQPGKYKLGFCFIYCTPNRVDDFDVTYSTKTEDVETKSSEGLEEHLRLSVIYRPIVTELYQLDTEIGPSFYEEVVAPEFKSACRGVFARHSYAELQKKNESIENEVEAEVRRRVAGKHIEIASITLESVVYASEIADKIRARIAGEQEAARQKAAMEWEAERKKQATEAAAAQKKLEIDTDRAQKTAQIEAEAAEKRMQLESEMEHQKLEAQRASETAKFRAEQQLASLDMEKRAVKAESEMSRLRAETEAQRRIIEARAAAEAARAMAKAKAEEARAETAGVTPMEVMLHAYDALGHLGGSGTTILLGDWAHVPNFLFPRVPSLQSAFTLPWMPYAPGPTAPAPAAPSAAMPAPSGGTILSSAGGKATP